VIYAGATLRTLANQVRALKNILPLINLRWFFFAIYI